MNVNTCLPFDKNTLQAIIGDPELVERLCVSAGAAGRSLHEGAYYELIRGAVTEAAEKQIAKFEKEVRDAEEKAAYDAKYPLSLSGTTVSSAAEIARVVTRHVIPPFEASREPSERDLRFFRPLVPDGAEEVYAFLFRCADSPYVLEQQENEDFSSLYAVFRTKSGAKMTFTVDVNDVERGTLSVGMNVLSDEPSETGFFGRVEHCVTAKVEYGWRGLEVSYGDVRQFLANTLVAFEEVMEKQCYNCGPFGYVMDAIDRAAAKKHMPSRSPSPSPRLKRARSEDTFSG